MTKAEIKWDAATDRKLLLGILQLQDVKVDSEALAEYMSTPESKPTVKSIQCRLSKLKTMAKKESAAGGDDGSPTKTPETPRKRAAAGTKATPRKKTPTGKKAKESSEEKEDDEESAGDGTEEKGGKQGPVKKESADEDLSK